MSALLFAAFGLAAMGLSQLALAAITRSAMRWKDNGNSADRYGMRQFFLAQVAVVGALVAAGVCGWLSAARP